MSVVTLEFQLPQEPASADWACRRGAAARKMRVLEAKSTDGFVVAVYMTALTSPIRVEITLSPAPSNGTRILIKGRIPGLGPVAKAQLRHHLGALRESIEAMPPDLCPTPPTSVRLVDYVGNFAGDQDIARHLCEQVLAPSMQAGEPLVLDFAGVELSTQSFVHTLVSGLVRSTDFDALTLIEFKNCSDSIRVRLETVVEYSLEDRSQE